MAGAGGVTRRRLLEIAGASFIAAACAPPAARNASAGPSTPAAAASSAASVAATLAPLGKPEKTSISFGILGPNLTSQVPVLVAQDKGFYKAAGFDEVKIVVTDQVTTGIIGGGLDFGVEQFLNISDSVTKGLPERMIGEWRTYLVVLLAVRPEIKTVKDLDGKEVLLSATPGSPDYDRRAGYLKEAGWDLSTVQVKPVTAPGGSDAWLRLWMDKKAWLIPVFNRHRTAVLNAGGRFLVDTTQWGNDCLGASMTTLQQRPNTTAQFLAATIRGMQVWADPKNKDYVLGMADRIGFKVTQDDKDAYEPDIKQYDAKADLGWEIAPMQAFLSQQFGAKAPTPQQLTSFDALNKAQRSLGLAPRPTS